MSNNAAAVMAAKMYCFIPKNPHYVLIWVKYMRLSTSTVVS